MSCALNILALNWRCTRHPQAGGSEVNLFEQARRWAADGHHVTVFCADPGREYALARDEVLDNVQVIRRGGRFTVYLFAALFILLNAYRYDRVLDVANGIPFLTPLFTRRPVILLAHHVHDRQWFTEFPYLLATVGWFLERRIVPFLYRQGLVIAVSPTTRDALVRIGFEPSRIQVIYNGVRVVSEPEARWYFGEHRIAYIGRIKHYKRLDRLVLMIYNLQKKFPDIRLDVAGLGDAMPDIEALIDELSLWNHVVIHGFVDEEKKIEILSRAAVFATPSMHEGWGLTVIEANSHGCPAVAYDVPGLRAAIRHGETGLLAQDDVDFEMALSLFLSNDEMRRRYAEAAREWAKTFSWDSCAQQTLKILLTAGLTRATALEKAKLKHAT